MKAPTLSWRVVVAAAGLLLACGPRPQHRPSVVPTPEVLAAEPAAGPIAVRVLWVTYAGAEGARADISRSRQEASDRAAMLAATARGDRKSFWSLVRSYGDRPPVADAGPVGKVVMRGDGALSTPVEAQAFRLQPGQVSAPVETAAGFAVVLRTQDPADKPTQLAAKHILISFEGAERSGSDQTRSKKEALALAIKVRKLVDEPDADWNALARQYTDEPGAQNGGDLGVFGPGQMVPAFERAAFALELGEVSAPIESPFGYHIIRRYK